MKNGGVVTLTKIMDKNTIITGKPTDFYIMSLEDVKGGVKRTKWADLVTPDIIKYFLTMNNPEDFYICDRRDNSSYRLIDLKEV